MANFGNSAYSATVGNPGGMMVLAAAGVGLATAIRDSLAAARDARYQARYDDALAAAINHASEMEAMARAAMEMLVELEAENNRLRAACQQRQAHIDRMKKGRVQ